MRNSSVVFIALALAPCFYWSTVVHADTDPGVSLESLMEAARRNHPTLAKQPLLANSLQRRREHINRSYWPQLSLGAQASWQSDVISLGLAIPGAMVPQPPKDQYGVTLKLKQSLWDGGMAKDQKRVVEQHSRIEQEKVNLDWYQLRERIVELYFAGLVQQELSAQAELLERYLATVVEKSELALAQGVVTKRDLMLVKARQLEARQALVDSKATLTRVRRSLNNLSGSKLSENAALASPITRCPNPETPPLANSEVQRPELRLLAAQGQLVDAQDQLDRAGDRPRLGLFATAGYGNPGLNPLHDEFDSYFIGGLQITVPLSYLYTGTHRNAREQVKIQHSLLDRQRDAVMTQISIELATQRTELEHLDASIVIDDALLDVREQARTQTDLQLALGTATMTDLINDLNAEDRARGQRSVHRAQRELACHQLALIKGDL